MARITISWRQYPTCPDATNYSRTMAYVGTFLGWVCNFLIIGLFCGSWIYMEEFLTKNIWSSFWGSVACFIACGIVAHIMYVVFPQYTEHKEKLIVLKYQQNGLSYDVYTGLNAKMKSDWKQDLRTSTCNYYFSFLIFVFSAALCFLAYYIYNSTPAPSNLVFAIMLVVSAVIIFMFRKHIRKVLFRKN